MQGNPWLRIPVEDYEAHMRDVGQSAALRDLFARVYAERRPSRLAVLGCTSGGDLERIDPAITGTAIGVDINPAYIEAARKRLGPRAARVRLICGDVLSVQLPPGELDLVHAALLFEHVDPAPLFARIHRWLSPDGVCSVITQEPSQDVPAVSASGYATLQVLAGHMVLRRADEIAALAERAGFRLVEARPVNVAAGKRLVSSLFAKI